MTTIDEFDVFAQLEQECTLQPQVETFDSHRIQSLSCIHPNVTAEYGICVCLDCGLELKKGLTNESKMYTSIDNRSMGDGNRCWAPKKKNKSIRDDLKGLGFPDPVINEADSIFKTVTEGGIFRVDKRKSIIVACLMEAYKILGERVSLENLLEKIPVDNISPGMKLVETKIKKYDIDRKRITHTSPIDSIRDILAGWDSSVETITQVIKLYELIEDKSSMLNRSRAKSVAAAVIYYYALATNRSNIKLKDFSKRVCLSESTIVKNAKEISAILQTPDVLAY
jgi:transcription initiation factor TFIIIB Brf1 subunit/transcription initiation factor TFIIB